MTSLWSDYSDQGVQMVAVCEGWWSGTEAQADAWLTGAGVTFPAVFDPPPFAIGSSAYGVSGVPRTFIIDTTMTIRYDYVGAVDCDEVRDALDSLLSESSPWPEIPRRIPKFMFGLRILDREIPRWMKVAYLILSMKTDKMFSKLDVRTGERFNRVVAGYLNDYLSEGKLPPDEVAAPILNLADDFMAGRVMSMRAGDYIAIQNHIRSIDRTSHKRA